MSRPAHSFTHLAGAPVHYDRLTEFPYGSRGRPARFYCTPAFGERLEACFSELWGLTGLGPAEVITSAGAHTEKPGMHGRGRAFDLDGLFWRDRAFVTLRAGYGGGDRRFYFGVEAVLRRHFGLVLDYLYNAAHRDHFHLDDSLPIGFRTRSRSTVLFLQGMLTYVCQRPVRIDGAWGPETASAVRAALKEQGLPGSLRGAGDWRRFLEAAARKSFDRTVPPLEPVAMERTPLELLHGVYGALREELGGTALAKPVEAAVNAFSNHRETQEWLERYRAAGR